MESKGGSLRIACGVVVAALGLVAVAVAAEKIYHAWDEPYHKAMFHNEKVHVYQVKLNPGEATFFHTHTYDQVGVLMRTAKITNQAMGQSESSFTTERGSMAYSPYTVLGPYTHRVRASGSDVFWNIGVELLTPAGDPAAKRVSTTPDQQKLVMPQGTMEHIVIAPQARWAAAGSLIITMSPGTLGTSENPTAWTFAEGELRWIEGATDVYVNASSAPVTLVVLSLKKA